MSENMGKIKNIGFGLIQIGSVKSRRRAIKDFWKTPKTAVDCILYKYLSARR
jgi:hypothetical protein